MKNLIVLLTSSALCHIVHQIMFTISQSVSIGSRGVKQIVIHEGYKPELLDRSYDDIALIKFDRPFFPETVETVANMTPICLPPSSAFKDEDKKGGCFWENSHHWQNPVQVLQWGLDWKNKKFAGQMRLDQISTKSAENKQFMHTRVSQITVSSIKATHSSWIQESSQRHISYHIGSASTSPAPAWVMANHVITSTEGQKQRNMWV